MKKFLILLTVCLIQFTFAMPAHKLEAMGEGYQIKLTVPDIVLTKVDVNDKLKDGTLIKETFIRVSISGFSISGEIGNPELLFSAFQLALEDKKLNVEITDVIEENISLKNSIYPLQPPEEYQNTNEYFSYNVDSYLRSN